MAKPRKIHLGSRKVDTLSSTDAGEQPSDLRQNHADTIQGGGPTGSVGPAAAPRPTGDRTRDFSWTYDTSSSVVGPMGLMNTGYVHGTETSEQQWARGDLPDMGYGYTFALRRPRFMREPRTDLGTYNFAKGR